MTQCLPEDIVKRYRRDGILTPLNCVHTAEAAKLLSHLSALEAREGGKLTKATSQKPYLLLPWLADLIRHPAILDPVQDLLGPDILCWGGGFFAKDPGDRNYVSWHQDSTYWGLSTPDVVTAWIAFTPSTVLSGCMRVIPGSHLGEQLPHRDTFADRNLLSRGQEIAVDVDESKALDVVLEAGQMSLHHVRIVHGSGPNRSRYRRIGMAIRYIATHVRQTAGDRDSATLVRGTDRYGHFELEPRPRIEFDPEVVAFHEAMRERTNQILYRGAERRSNLP